MLSYAGVSVLQPTAELLAWGRRHLDWSWATEWTARAFPGARLTHLGQYGLWQRPPVEIGRLYWPWGAARFGHCHVLATQGQLDAIRAAGANQDAALPLTVSDGVRAVSPALHLLPPRPLTGVPGAGQAWLLPLVDLRYRWWFRAGDLSADGATTTWADLFGQIGDALGVTLEVDDVPAIYPPPDNSLTLHYEALPLVLDAAAASVGMRVVVGTDGEAVEVIGPTTALNRTAGNLATSDLARLAGAGGQMALAAP